MAFDAFLKIEGIDGESKTGDIPLESFSWGVSNAASAAAGSGRGERAMFHDFSFVALVAKQSPQIFEAAAKGKHLTFATLTVSKTAPNGTNVEALMIKFNEVVISSYKLDEGGLPAVQLGAPMESVSFNFESLTFTANGVVGSGGPAT